jgi:ABC-type transporter MlaC component
VIAIARSTATAAEAARRALLYDRTLAALAVTHDSSAAPPREPPRAGKESIMSLVRRFVLTAASAPCMLACLTGSGGATDAEDAAAFLSDTHRKISEIRLDETHSPDEKRALIERLLDERLGFPTMARVALGKRRDAFSETELSEFLQEYTRFLNYTYLREIAWSDPTEIPTITDATVDPETRVVTITTKTKQRNSLANQRGQYRQSSVMHAEYLLRPHHGSWLIVRMSFNGVDLNSAFGSQFESQLQKATPEEVLADLHKLNRERELSNPLE